MFWISTQLLFSGFSESEGDGEGDSPREGISPIKGEMPAVSVKTLAAALLTNDLLVQVWLDIFIKGHSFLQIWIAQGTMVISNSSTISLLPLMVALIATK